MNTKMLELLNREIKQIIDGRYFIAGGACIDVMNNTRLELSNDVDIFFENQEDFDMAHEDLLAWGYHSVKFESPNARMYTYNEPSPVFESPNTLIHTNNELRFELVQLIKIFNTPEDTLERFDLNKSQIGITSKGEVIVHKNFKGPLKINYQNFKSDTQMRYIKYATTKGFNWDDDSIDELFDYLIEDHEVETTYNLKNETVKTTTLLTAFITQLNEHNILLVEDSLNLVVNKISNKTTSEFVEIFGPLCNFLECKKIQNPLVYLSMYKNLITNVIDASLYYELYKQKFGKYKYEILTETYPEYFV